ncbi:MAG: MFS transporter, partial [Oscillospiraceae bacterium]|nr:MFS transporter [Oscillospiraceae bacterium]
MRRDREAQRRAETKLWSRNFIIIALSNLVVLCGGNMLVTTFPFYVVKLGGDNVTVGIAAAVFSVCAFVSRPAAGWILDNKTRRTVLFVCMTAVMIICPLYLVLPYIGCLIVLRAMHGMFWASTGSGLNTNVTDILPKLRFGEGMAWFGLTNSMAMIIGPATGLMIWEKWGAVPVFLTVSVTTLITMLLLTRFDFKTIPKRKFQIEGSPIKWAVNL